MRRVIALSLLTLGISVIVIDTHSDTTTCKVKDELLAQQDCQSIADASWEGLDGDQQSAILATGLKGTELDQLVINVRFKIEEDEVGWDCRVMGNMICGKVNQ